MMRTTADIKKVYLKPSERYSMTVLGIVFTVLSLALLLSQVMFLLEYAKEPHQDMILNVIGLVIFSYTTFWSARYIYRGIKGYNYIKVKFDKPINRTQPVSTKGKWGIFAGFVGACILYGYALLTNEFSADNWKSWLYLLGMVFFSIFAILSLMSIIKGWTIDEDDDAFEKAIGYAFKTPIVLAIFLIVAALLIWVGISVFGWFTSIPSWAAVIIVLLVLILLKR